MLIVEVNHGELQSICACYQNNLPDIEVLRNILNLEILSESPQRKLSRQMAFCKKKEIRKLCGSREPGPFIFWAAGNYLDCVMLNV